MEEVNQEGINIGTQGDGLWTSEYRQRKEEEEGREESRGKRNQAGTPCCVAQLPASHLLLSPYLGHDPLRSAKTHNILKRVPRMLRILMSADTIDIFLKMCP